MLAQYRYDVIWTYTTTGSESSNTNNRRATTRTGNTIRRKRLIHLSPVRSRPNRSQLLILVVGRRVHVSKINSDALVDTIGSLPRRVRAAADSKRAVLPRQDLSQLGHVLCASGQDHAPRSLGGVGRIVALESRIVELVVAGDYLAVELLLAGQRIALRTISNDSIQHALQYWM